MGDIKKIWGTPPNPRQRVIPLDFPFLINNCLGGKIGTPLKPQQEEGDGGL
jgi:hypothetical protein